MNGFVLMVVSIFIGSHILAFFGISLPVGAGGRRDLVVATGWTLLRHSDDDDRDTTEEEAKEAVQRGELPATGLLSTDAAIDGGPQYHLLAITVEANPDGGAEWRWPLITGLLIGAAAIAVSIYLSYRFAEGIAEALGDAAMNVNHPALVLHPCVHPGADYVERAQRSLRSALVR
jgi:multiple antibiotic resistance protein